MSRPLTDLQAVTSRAATLLGEASGRILLFASPAMITDLRQDLAAAHRRGCPTEVICARPVAGVRGGFTIVPESTATSPASLQMVVDGEKWLVASVPETDEPAGCWGGQRPVAAALAATLDTLRRTGVHRAEMASADGDPP